MNLSNEQIKAILDGAPKDATHYGVYWGDILYFKENKRCVVIFSSEESAWTHKVQNRVIRECGSIHHLREILTLRQEAERLKAQQSEVAARAVEDAIKACPSKGRYSLPLVDTCELYDYANQLREQGGE